MMRTSELLRGILTKNPGVTSFSVERILASIGSERVEASLMVFSLAGIVPVRAPRAVVAAPTAAVGYQLATGQKELRLPRFILEKRVSRRALAVAIHAIVPVLEASEKLVKPRWRWFSQPIARRVVGFFLFLLALAIAQPVFGFEALHALSVFVISLGMAEQDGLAIMLGIVAGIVSLAILAASSVSVCALRARVFRALRKLARKLGLSACADFLERLGYPRIASVLRLEWADLVMTWDPEANSPQPAPNNSARRCSAAMVSLSSARA